LRKVEEYRRHADECRQLASLASTDEHREQLLQMVEMWNGLAEDRQEQLARSERIAALELRNFELRNFEDAESSA